MVAKGAERVALVVEDEVIIRTDIVGELAARGWHVLESASGEEALALLEARAVDVLFTDIQLAGSICGWELARKAREADEHLSVIYTSGNCADRSHRVEGSLFFAKPYFAADVAMACQNLAANEQRMNGR